VPVETHLSPHLSQCSTQCHLDSPRREWAAHERRTRLVRASYAPRTPSRRASAAPPAGGARNAHVSLRSPVRLSSHDHIGLSTYLCGFPKKNEYFGIAALLHICQRIVILFFRKFGRNITDLLASSRTRRDHAETRRGLLVARAPQSPASPRWVRAANPRRRASDITHHPREAALDRLAPARRVLPHVGHLQGVARHEARRGQTRRGPNRRVWHHVPYT